jgi:hypothetical protein
LLEAEELQLCPSIMGLFCFVFPLVIFFHLLQFLFTFKLGSPEVADISLKKRNKRKIPTNGISKKSLLTDLAVHMDEGKQHKETRHLLLVTLFN